MRVWQSYYGNGVVGIAAETAEEEKLLMEFVMLRRLESSEQIMLAADYDFVPPQKPCPDCGFDGRHHS